jgi:hypothetical protein
LPSSPSRDRVTLKSRDSESDDGITGTATVNYLGTAKMIRIGVDIQNQKVNAIIDTGAQVTILNDQIFDQLPSKPYSYLGSLFLNVLTCYTGNNVYFPDLVAV